MRKAFVAGISVAVLLLAVIWGCGGGGSSSGGSNNNPGGSTTRSIAAKGNASAPTGFTFDSPITVKSGTTVKWVNQSAGPHNIVWDSAPAGAPSPGAGIGTFAAGATSDAWVAPTVTADTTYPYHCGIHGPMMSGTIVVTP
jgi:plastocyanin